MITIGSINYNICEVSQRELKEIHNKRKANNEENLDSINDRYFGSTFTDDCVIYIDKDLPKERKKKTLIHELTHCYINEYITHQEKSYDEEMVADIVANSYKTINSIIEKYNFGE